VTFYFYSTKHMNIKKLFSVAAVVTFLGSTFLPGLALAATPDTELGKAYEWAYANGITTKDTYEAANMTAPITRAEMAKMLSNYAKKFQEKTPDTSATCNFNDTASVGGDLAVAIVESCQLGIMGQGISNFRPYDTITRAEFGTALSRVLWDKTYEGGTPYYAGHLNALKAAGIMTVIANAESMKEVRGYVMLMLMRSENETPSICEETDVKVICAVEEAAEEYKDCPAACRKDNSKEEDNGEDEVVKSGSLVVSSSAADDRSVVVPAAGKEAVSDLDTLTFKTSEEVTISKIVLEKYGFSKADDLIAEEGIWLEDEDGNEITTKSTPNSKGLVNLTVKKDYKKVDGTFNATIVVKTKGSDTVSNGSIGFKVSDVISTAKDVDLWNYKAYKYDIVAYDGVSAKVTARWGSKDYNWEAGESYEISKFKIKAPDDSAIVVKSITLTNKAIDGDEDVLMDTYDFLDVDSIEVSVAGKTVKANASINKDEELTISFKSDVELSAKENVEFIVSAELNDDFDEYGEYIHFTLWTTDVSATDKNNARITVTVGNADFLKYKFNGGKVKFTNNKLGNVDASINSNDVLIADGTVSIGESLEWKATLTISNKSFLACPEVNDTECTDEEKTTTLYPVNAIEEIRLLVADDEVNGTITNKTSESATVTFNNLDITESGKVKVYVDLDEDARYQGQSMTFSSITWELKYSDATKTSAPLVDKSGSISVSKLNLTEAKGSLTNTVTDDVEYNNNEVNTYTIFEWVYTAKKNDIYLNEFTVTQVEEGKITTASPITFYLSIDGDEVADAKFDTTKKKASDSFSDTLIKAGQSAKIKLEAEIDAKENLTTENPKKELGKFELVLKGIDENDNDAGSATKKTTSVSIVTKGAVSVSTANTKNTVLRKAADAKIAEFTVKPDWANSTTLEDISFKLTFTPNNYEGEANLYVDGTNETLDCSAGSCSASLNKDVDSDWVAIRVELDSEYAGTVTLDTLKINDKPFNSRTFKKRFENAVVSISKQSSDGASTKFTLSLDKKSSDSISNVEVCLAKNATATIVCSDEEEATTPWTILKKGEVSDWDTASVLEGNEALYVVALRYKITDAEEYTTINKYDYEDFFKIGEDDVIVKKASNN